MLATALARLPRLSLAQLPTPLEPAPRLGRLLGMALTVKREDQSGLGLGGNKPRQIEVLLGEAVRRGADTVITTAGSQSNFCRALAAGCARAGLGCLLLLRDDGRVAAQGNYLLDRLFGAEIRLIRTLDPYDPAIRGQLDALAAEVRARGGRPQVIQLPGASGPLAAAAAAGLASELLAQWLQPPGLVCLAAGSGLTAAGLLLGLQAAGAPTRVLAVSVQQEAGFIRELILRRAREAADVLGIGVPIDPRALLVDDRSIGPGYGIATEESLDALTLAARSEGLVLDPAYSGKALAGLIAYAKERAEEKVSDTLSVTFVHTGGAPTLFAQAAAVATHLGLAEAVR